MALGLMSRTALGLMGRAALGLMGRTALGLMGRAALGFHGLWQEWRGPAFILFICYLLLSATQGTPRGGLRQDSVQGPL